MSRRKPKIEREIDPDESEIEGDDIEDDIDPALQADGDLQAYLREMREQEQRRAAAYVPPSTGARSKTTMSSVSQSQSRSEPSAQPSASQTQPQRRWERIRTPSTYRVPPLGPTLPERSTSPGNVPKIVDRLRSKSGFPDFDLMREDVRESEPIQGSKQDIAKALSKRSLEGIKQVWSVDRGKDERKDNELHEKKEKKQGYEKKIIDPKKGLRGIRYKHPKTTIERFPDYRHSPLQPSSQYAPDQTDRRFHQRVKKMGGEKKKSTFLPSGRMGYGDLSGYDMTAMRRILEDSRQRKSTAELKVNIPGVVIRDDPTHWTPRQLAFSNRLQSLSPEERRIYNDLQRESNPELQENAGAVSRMTPRPTLDDIRKANAMRLGAIKSSKAQRDIMDRKQRRQNLYLRSILPSAINPKKTLVMTPLKEDQKSHDEYTYHTYSADPETSLILSTRRENEMIARQKLKKLQEVKEELKKKEESSAAQEQEEEEVPRRELVRQRASVRRATLPRQPQVVPTMWDQFLLALIFLFVAWLVFRFFSHPR